MSDETDAVNRLRARAAEAATAQPPSEPEPAQPESSQPEPSQPEAAAEPEPAGEPEPAAEPDPAAESEPDAGPGSPARPTFAGRLPLAVLAAVLVAVLAAALATVVAARVSAHNATAAARTDALGAATSGVATVLSYDYRHLDRDFATAEALLTPRFRKQYVATTAKGVKPLAAKYRAVSSADVTAAGVVQADADRAVVLVLVSQTVTNNRLAQPRLDRSRIDVTLVKRDGRWLIDRLDPI